MGYRTMASGDWSTAIGVMTSASGNSSTAMGGMTNAIGNNSTTMGAWTTASGAFSIATGYNTNASGMDAIAMGFYTNAKPFASLCLGVFNDTTCSFDGNHLWIATDPVFIIGNGSWFDSRSNAFTVLKNGNTAIGHASPTQMLDVNGNARFRAVGSGAYAYNLNIMSDGTLTTATSDIRMKENIYQITNALDKVTKLRGVFFNWKNDSTKIKQIGMIAQEVEPIVPEIVFTNPVDGLKGINYSQASALFVEAIKEQQKQIESTKQENQQLRSELNELKALVNNLIANQTAPVTK